MAATVIADPTLFEKRDHPPLLVDERVDPRRLGVEEVGDLASDAPMEDIGSGVSRRFCG